MGIRISEKHGVNPSLSQCFVCMEAKGLVLLGKLPGDKEAPRQMCIDKEPCDKCKAWMEQGVILISVKDGEENDNPYRTGGWVVIKDEAIRRMVKPQELCDSIIARRMAFVPDEAWDAMGLPRENQPAVAP